MTSSVEDARAWERYAGDANGDEDDAVGLARRTPPRGGDEGVRASRTETLGKEEERTLLSRDDPPY